MTSWEWRIFFKDKIDFGDIFSQKNDGIKDLLKNAKVEKRRDYYWDLGSKIYGLKERWTKVGDEFFPVVELKIRQDIDEKSRYEAWDKCLSLMIPENFTEEGLTIDQMKRYLDILSGDLEYDKHVEYIKSKLDQVNRVLIEKEKTQIQYPLPNETDDKQKTDVYLIEATELINIKFGAISIDGYKTICIEGSNFIGLNKIVNSINNQLDGLKMGYPEFIIKMIQS